MSKATSAISRGYQLPETIDPPQFSVCVPIPNDASHIRAFLGQLDMLGYWWTWERDDDKRGTQAAQVWRDIVDTVRRRIDSEELCTVSAIWSRVTSDGTYQESTDCGETWHDAPCGDPRQSLPQLPPQEGDTAAQTRCKAANSGVAFFQDAVAQQSQALADGKDKAAIAAIIVGILLLLGLVTGGLLDILAYAVAVIVAGVSQETFDASFDEDVWNALTCIFYKNIGDDGRATEAQLTTIKSETDTLFGFASAGGAFILGLMNAMGVGGFNNAMALPSANEADCGCLCGVDTAKWEILDGLGVIDSITDTTITVHGTGSGVRLWSADAFECATVTSIDGTTGAQACNDCGTAWDGTFEFVGINLLDRCVCVIGISANTSVTFHFS